MSKTEFNNQLVNKVSEYLQRYMMDNNLKDLTADDCATLLAKANILSNEIGPKAGFNFRQLLRDGRDGKINLVTGVYQERSNTKWIISRK